MLLFRKFFFISMDIHKEIKRNMLGNDDEMDADRVTLGVILLLSPARLNFIIM
jgi:hypothetical protein